MTPYIVVFMISIGLFALSDRVKYTQRKPIVFISVMALCLLAGMRAVGVGTDTRVYLMPVYEAAKRSHSIGEYLNSSFHAFTWTTDYVKDMEPLFPLLVLIVTKITGSLYCVQTILELCVILPLYVAVRKDKNTSLGMAMFVFCMAFYNPSMNMMRQSIAMSLGVLGFEYWKNAEKKNAFICVIIAFLFHTSSLLILLIYLLYDYIVKGTTLSITGNNVSKRNETPRMLISMGIGFVVMIMMSAIVSALSAVGFGEYVSYVTGKLVFMPNQLLIRIPQIILIIWSYRYLRKDGEDISFFLVIIANFIVAIYAIIAGKGYKAFSFHNIDRCKLKEMIRYSVVLIPNTFMWWIMNSSDRVMVTYMIGAAANGIYAVSYKLPTLVYSSLKRQALKILEKQRMNSSVPEIWRISLMPSKRLCSIWGLM